MRNTTTDQVVVTTPDAITEMVRVVIREELRTLANTNSTRAERDSEHTDRRLTLDEVRLRLKMSRPTVLGLLRSGKLRGHRPNDGGSWVIPESSLLAFLRGSV